jgi:hypothetical protein
MPTGGENITPEIRKHLEMGMAAPVGKSPNSSTAEQETGVE